MSMSPLPRLEFHELPPSLAAKLEPRVQRLGYLGEFFRCAAHQPQALEAFIDFTEAAKRDLPKRLVEVVALTAARWMDNAYELNQHERLSVRLGFGRDWVAEVIALRPSEAKLMSREDCEVQSLVLTVLESRGKAAGPLFEQSVRSLGAANAIAVMMVIARYVAHAMIVNTLALAPPVPSIFEDGFNG
ncbi:MAG TPA: carboxymuconolactone decarboxylase family protein [Steroidobacter sp.]|uniref:carboxymuconolactone decarboxylase family protein n=1 Tax=Steroidobacter sp. TaxID=1978227 RepID=UPI002EDB780B